MNTVLRRIVLTIIPVILLPGCFTGIESTPKITSKDLRREQIHITNEERILADIAPQPLGQWQPGKEFFVTDTKLGMALEPSSGAVPPPGSIIRFSQWRQVPSLSGTNDTELIFTTPNGESLIYRINADHAEISDRQRVSIPFSIEMSVVDSVRNRLRGKEVYVKTSTWYDTNGDHTLRGAKYIPVKITDVVPGNLAYPVKILFEQNILDENPAASLYMAIDDSKGPRSFSNLFSTTNPRDNHPEITDEIWKNITRSRVAKYMTRDECRLAIGSPNSVKRRNAISSLQEMWTYDNGIYLIFEDGLLTSFRQ